MKYIYFVSFHAESERFTSTYTGFGNTQVSLGEVVTSIDQIREIESAIKRETGAKQIAIIQYKLLRIDKAESGS